MNDVRRTKQTDAGPGPVLLNPRGPKSNPNWFLHLGRSERRGTKTTARSRARSRRAKTPSHSRVNMEFRGSARRKAGKMNMTSPTFISQFPFSPPIPMLTYNVGRSLVCSTPRRVSSSSTLNQSPWSDRKSNSESAVY